MKTYHRYDICPSCSTRLDFNEDKRIPDDIMDSLIRNGILHIDSVRLYYKGEEIKSVYCSGCNKVYEQREVLDYWSAYYMDKDLD